MLSRATASAVFNVGEEGRRPKKHTSDCLHNVDYEVHLISKLLVGILNVTVEAVAAS